VKKLIVRHYVNRESERPIATHFATTLRDDAVDRGGYGPMNGRWRTVR